MSFFEVCVFFILVNVFVQLNGFRGIQGLIDLKVCIPTFVTVEIF